MLLLGLLSGEKGLCMAFDGFGRDKGKGREWGRRYKGRRCDEFWRREEKKQRVGQVNGRD